MRKREAFIALTSAGEAILHNINGISHAISDVEKGVVGLQTHERGLVTVAVTEGIGSIWLLSNLPEFYDRFPSIDLRIKTNQRDVDLLSHDADIALQLERPSKPRMVAYKATKVAHRLFASRSYIERKGLPEKRADLEGHDFLDYEPYHSEPYTEWWVRDIVLPSRVKLSCNSANIYLAALSPCLADLFPTRTRTRTRTFSISMAYNIAASFHSGLLSGRGSADRSLVPCRSCTPCPRAQWIGATAHPVVCTMDDRGSRVVALRGGARVGWRCDLSLSGACSYWLCWAGR